MEAILEQELKLDKSSWQKVRIGDVVREPKESVKDPATSGIQHVIGLEHIESEDIHLRNYATLEESTTFTKAFKKGDVLFGRRRAYLKKAALAKFSGICSGDITVFRAKESLLPELLPFIVNNDKFFDYAVKHSAGGLSPRVKFKDLANYEFLLPPIKKQVQLAELLWAIDEVIEKEHIQRRSLQFFYDTLVDNKFSIKKDQWEYIKLSEIALINNKSLKSDTPPDFTFKYLDIAGIIEPKVVGELQTYTYSESPSRARRIVIDNSIVLSLVRPYHKSFAYIKRGDGIIASTGTGVINVKDEKLSRFIFHQFFTKRFILFCENRMTGTNYPAITPTDLKDFRIAIPKNESEIENLTEKLDSIEKNISKSQVKIHVSKSLQKSLINQIF